MPLNFPGLFPPSKETYINFNWVDIASATGFISYDVYKTLDDGGVNRHLVDSTKIVGLRSISGHSGTTSHAMEAHGFANGVFAKIFDYDYDLSDYKLPVVIRGDVFVNFSFYLGKPAGNTLTYFIARVRKWDGSTETEIASTTTDTITHTATQAAAKHAIKITVTQTSFKVGENLRITIEGWAKTTSGTGILGVAGNPADTEDNDGSYAISAGNTRINILIPYKLNV